MRKRAGLVRLICGKTREISVLPAPRARWSRLAPFLRLGKRLNWEQWKLPSDLRTVVL